MIQGIKRLRGILSMHITWPYLLSLFFVFVILFVLFYKKIENFYVFYTMSDIELTPEDLHMNYRNVYFYTKDGEKLHGWFFPSDNAPVILYCHGNACNISHLLEYADLIIEKNLQVFLFDYRGYGKSTGTPSESGIYLDAQAAYDYLTNEEKLLPDKIIPTGHSIGAAAAIDIAIKNGVRSVIIESAFTSTKDMSKRIFPMNLISFLLPANYNNLEKVKNIGAPKLFIHGLEDEIIPFGMGKKLFDTSMEPKYFYRIKGAGHNDTFIVGGEIYFKTLSEFAYNSRADISD